MRWKCVKKETWRENIAAMSHMPTFLSCWWMNCNHYTVKDAAALWWRSQTENWEKNNAAVDETNWVYISANTKCAVYSFWNGPWDFFVNRLDALFKTLCTSLSFFVFFGLFSASLRSETVLLLITLLKRSCVLHFHHLRRPCWKTHGTRMTLNAHDDIQLHYFGMSVIFEMMCTTFITFSLETLGPKNYVWVFKKNI